MSPRGTIPSKKIMFAHIALLGFQRAGGITAVFRHAHYFTPPSRFCKSGKTIFSSAKAQALYANEKSVFKNAHLPSHFEENSMNCFEQRLADAFTSSEA